MSFVETPTADCVVQQRVNDQHRNHSSKRKLDDYVPVLDDEDAVISSPVENLYAIELLARVSRDEPNPAVNSSFVGATAMARVSGAPSSSSSRAPSRNKSTSSGSQLQFFVRMMSPWKTLVMYASPHQTVISVHQKIGAITGIPVFEQGLIYRGKQLQWEHTLAECGIQKDANLQLVGRMRSTEHPQAWQTMDKMVSLIRRLCRGEIINEASKEIKSLITSYLVMTPKGDDGSVASYFDIFVDTCAPSMLVTLYVSPFHGNKDPGECSIRHFLDSCRYSLSKAYHGHCAKVLLDFCKLLSRVGRDDPLYVYCRSTLGFMLQAADVSFSFGCSYGNRVVGRGVGGGGGCIVLLDICPFVREISAKLLRDLRPTSLGPLFSDVRDFSLFLNPWRKGIADLQAMRGLGANGKCRKDSLLAEEVDYVHLIFIQLLSKMDECLCHMEEFLADKQQGEGDITYSSWSMYLSILKELYETSKLFDDADDKFWMVLRDHRSMVSLLIIRYANLIDDHRWVLEHKGVTNFEARRHLAMIMFPNLKENYEELHEMLIDRSQILAESYEYIAKAKPASLHAGLFMEFKNEEATGPGVLREWFLLVCQALFNPENSLFVPCPNDHRRFYPNPASKVDPLHLKYFSFSGRVIALALMHKVQVGIIFDRVFFKQLAGKSITLEDVQDADPYLYSSCQQILEMDADFIDSDALGLTFVREVDELGDRKVVELCPGGKSLVVNSRNREKYVDLLIRNRFVTSISEQVSYFAKGFGDMLRNSRKQQFFFQSLEPEDLDCMLCGSEDIISVEDWKTHTDYNGYKETDCQISWFWEIVGRMSAEERKVLLFFWTSVKYLPVEGFRGLASRLNIYKSLELDDRLPSSHTCFYRLCFPAYSSKAVMQDRLRVITQEHIGCSFGTW